MTSITAAPRAEKQATRWLLPMIWVALTLILVIKVPELPWRRAADQLRSVTLGWLAVALLTNAAILPLWTAEWRLLVPGAFRVAFRTMFEIVAATAAVLNSVPFFAGEASAVALLIGHARLTQGAALSVLAMDQLLVGLGKLVVVAVAALYVPLPTWLRAGVLSLTFGVAALLAVLLLVALRGSEVRERLIVRPTALRVLAARLLQWSDHLDALRDPGRLWRLASLALAKKAAELLAILAVQAAFGLQPTLAGALLVLAALAVTTLLPVAPANLGVYEATVFAAYRFVGIPAETAVGLAIVQHLCFLLPPLAIGYGVLTLRPLVRRSREP